MARFAAHAVPQGLLRRGAFSFLASSIVIALMSGGCGPGRTTTPVIDPPPDPPPPHKGPPRLVRGSGSHVCIDDAGVVQCWGLNLHGQLGTPDPAVDGLVTLARDATAVAVGGSATCILESDGTVACTGDVPLDLHVTSLTTHTAVRGIETIRLSSTALCTYGPAGGVACLGRGDTGLLGPEVSTDSRTLVAIPLTGAVADLQVSTQLACVLTSDHRVMCWGQAWNGLFQGGYPNTGYAASARPTEVKELAGATAIALGDHHACALVAGRAWCWGGNAHGQLATGALNYDFVPHPIFDLEELVGLAAGSDHTCAWDARGRAYCWGNNDFGQCGNGYMGPSFPPGKVVDLSGVVAMTAGVVQSCAETTTGAIYCWGYDSHGVSSPRPHLVVPAQ